MLILATIFVAQVALVIIGIGYSFSLLQMVSSQTNLTQM